MTSSLGAAAPDPWIVPEGLDLNAECGPADTQEPSQVAVAASAEERSSLDDVEPGTEGPFGKKPAGVLEASRAPEDAGMRDLAVSGVREADATVSQPSELIGEHPISEPGVSALNKVPDVEMKQAQDATHGGGGSDFVENDDDGDVNMREMESEVSRTTEKPTVNDAALVRDANSREVDGFHSYGMRHEENGEFFISDLVWGKVKSHPWWPGQIFDPEHASEMALKHQRKDNFLVAYFGDKTFAWCDESQLKPFHTSFSHMEKQSSSEVFRDAVSSALDEVSRRVELGMLCHCAPEESYSDLMHQAIENAGIADDVRVSVYDRSLDMSTFQPSQFLEYLLALATSPMGDVDQLHLAIARAQMVAFYRSKGCTRLSTLFICKGVQEEGTATPRSSDIPARDLVEGAIPVTVEGEKVSSSTTFGRGRPKNRRPKIILDDGRKQKSLSDLIDADMDDHFVNGGGFRSETKVLHKSMVLSSCKKVQNIDSVPTEAESCKTKRLDSLGDIEHRSPSPFPHNSFKIGECIRRVANKLTGLSPSPKCNADTSQKTTTGITDSGCENPFSLDSPPHSPEEIQTEKADIFKDHSLSEMQFQLHIAATDPLKGYAFQPSIVNFFTEIRNFRVPISTEGNKSSGRRRGRPKSVPNPSAADTTTQPEKIKRKRGRPRLVPHSSSVEPSEKVKRKRGRPRSVHRSDVTEDAKAPEKIVRKRGRKKKLDANMISSEYREVMEKVEHKRGRKSAPKAEVTEAFAVYSPESASVIAPDSTLEFNPALASDNMKDSYWTDMVIQTKPEKKRRGRKRKEESQMTSSAKNVNLASEPSDFLPLSSVLDIPQHLRVSSSSPSKSYALASERLIKYFGNKRVEESTPTAVILCFSDSFSVPSRTEVLRIFSRYGPLIEAQTEILGGSNQVTVVFKRQADAEVAFSSAGKCGFFGSALLSYRIKYLYSPENSGNAASHCNKNSVPLQANDNVVGITSKSEAPTSDHIKEVDSTNPDAITNSNSNDGFLAITGTELSENLEYTDSQLLENPEETEHLEKRDDIEHILDPHNVELQDHQTDETFTDDGQFFCNKCHEAPQETSGDINSAKDSSCETVWEEVKLLESLVCQSTLEVQDIEMAELNSDASLGSVAIIKDEKMTDDSSLEMSDIRKDLTSVDFLIENTSSRNDTVFDKIDAAATDSRTTESTANEALIDSRSTESLTSKISEKPDGVSNPDLGMACFSIDSNKEEIQDGMKYLQPSPSLSYKNAECVAISMQDSMKLDSQAAGENESTTDREDVEDAIKEVVCFHDRETSPSVTIEGASDIGSTRDPVSKMGEMHEEEGHANIDLLEENDTAGDCDEVVLQEEGDPKIRHIKANDTAGDCDKVVNQEEKSSPSSDGMIVEMVTDSKKHEIPIDGIFSIPEESGYLKIQDLQVKMATAGSNVDIAEGGEDPSFLNGECASGEMESTE